MVTRKAARTTGAGKSAAKHGHKRRLSRQTKPAVMRTSEASMLTIKEAVRLYAPALRRLADR
jgi:hypothetical protein